MNHIEIFNHINSLENLKTIMINQGHSEIAKSIECDIKNTYELLNKINKF